MPFNRTYKRVFSLPHRPTLRAVQNLIDLFNRTARQAAYASTKPITITLNIRHLQLILLVIALISVLFIVLLLSYSFCFSIGRNCSKRRLRLQSSKRTDDHPHDAHASQQCQVSDGFYIFHVMLTLRCCISTHVH